MPQPQSPECLHVLIMMTASRLKVPEPVLSSRNANRSGGMSFCHARYVLLSCLLLVPVLLAIPIDLGDDPQNSYGFSAFDNITQKYSVSGSAQVDGNYPLSRFTIFGCDGFQRARLSDVIASAQRPVIPAINDLPNKQKNTLPFNAWFGLDAKSSPVNTDVSDVLKKIKDLSRPSPFRKPTLICAYEDLAHDFPKLRPWYWEWCENHQKPFGQGMTAFTMFIDSQTVICPAFWALPWRPSGRQCLSVNSNNERAGNTFKLIRYQSYVLAHELVHTYLGKSSLGWDTVPKEVYGEGQCMNLGPKEQAKNPNNYQFYFASETYLLLVNCEGTDTLQASIKAAKRHQIVLNRHGLWMV